MRLTCLLQATPLISVIGSTDLIIITGLSADSRLVRSGDLFFALPGSKENGATFAEDAVKKGAVAIVTSSDCLTESFSCVPIIQVIDARRAMADLAASFYGNASLSLAIAGVTGTNGKTTTTWIIHHLCDMLGRPSGLIGTVEYLLPGFKESSVRTTPDSIDLQRMLALMRDGGFKAASLEVSSHALMQHRVRKIEFDVAVFTNLTQDHLDYHSSMEEYFEAKISLFTMIAQQSVKKGKAVINADDRYGRRLLDRIGKIPSITYGQGAHCKFRASNIRYKPTGTTFALDAKGRSYFVRSPLIGLFNVYNTLAALATTSVMGLDLRRAIAAVATIPQIPGRLERVPGNKNFHAFVDYAHTPDALENVLSALRQLGTLRIITVFGCGGDRDRSKRPLMAAIAERYSDKVIITSDNPRSEDPLTIITEIQKGFLSKSHEVILDRERAINRAVEIAEADDIILIAGKGHERYQEIATRYYPFHDFSVTLRAMIDKVSIGAQFS